jgi:hypothetical protein
MDMRRYLPMLLLVFAALFILPTLLKGRSSKTLSSKDRGVLTIDAVNRIDNGQQAIFKTTRKYTSSIADIAIRDKVLSAELTIPLDVKLTTGSDGRSYVAQVTSDIFSLAVGRVGANAAVTSCRELKTTSGVDCPAGTTAPTTTTSTTTSPTTTSTSTTGTITTVTTGK